MKRLTKLRRYISHAVKKAVKNAVEEEHLDPDRPPTAWPYRRCSHEDSRESGIGLDVQAIRITSYIDVLLANNPGLVRAPMTEDSADLAISAWKYNFDERPAGRALFYKAQRGDHIIVAEMTRGFRNTKDFLNTLDRLNSRGITLHLADMNLDMTSPVGRMTGSILAVVAEWQAAEMSIRQKAIAARDRRLGHAGGGRPPVGWINTGARGKRVRNPDPKLRALMMKIIDWRDKDGLSWWKIADEIEEYIAARAIRMPYKRGEPGRQWSKNRCHAAYVSALAILEHDQAAKDRRKKFGASQ